MSLNANVRETSATTWRMRKKETVERSVKTSKRERMSFKRKLQLDVCW